MEISIKNRPCYLFNDMINDMINIKHFDPRLLEINKWSFKGVFSVNIYCIKFLPTKIPDHVNIDDKGFLYLTFNNVNGCFIKNDGIKYLGFDSTDESK